MKLNEFRNERKYKGAREELYSNHSRIAMELIIF